MKGKNLVAVASRALFCLVFFTTGCFENLPEDGFSPQPEDNAKPSSGIERARALFAPEGGEIRLRLHVLEASGERFTGLSLDSFEIVPFFGEESGRSYQFSTVKVGSPSPFFSGEGLSVAVVIDQSEGVVNADPQDLRIEAANRLLSSLRAGDEAVVFAFASGGALPYPVTFWNGFSGDLDVFSDTLASLSDLEGGLAPLYDAVAAALQLTETDAANQDRVVVVLATGLDAASSSFRSPSQVVEFAGELGIPVVVAGLGKGIDFSALSAMGLESGGMFFPIERAEQLLAAFKGLPAILRGESKPYSVRVTMTVEPPTLPFSGTLTPEMEITLPDSSTIVLPIVLTW